MEFKTKLELNLYMENAGHKILETCFWYKNKDGNFELVEIDDGFDGIEPEEEKVEVSYIGDMLFSVAQNLIG